MYSSERSFPRVEKSCPEKVCSIKLVIHSVHPLTYRGIASPVVFDLVLVHFIACRTNKSVHKVIMMFVTRLEQLFQLVWAQQKAFDHLAVQPPLLGFEPWTLSLVGEGSAPTPAWDCPSRYSTPVIVTSLSVQSKTIPH